MEKSRLENIWRSHEKSCRPISLNTPSNQFIQSQQHQQHQQQSSNSSTKMVKRDELNDFINQNQTTDKKQQTPSSTGLIPNPSQLQPPSILRCSPQGTLSIPVGSPSLEDQKSLSMILQAAAVANSALLTPKSAFANNSIENLLNQIEQQNSNNSAMNNSNSGSNKIQSPTQPQFLDLGNGGLGSSTLQRPNNLNLRGSSLASTPTGMGNSPNPSCLTSAFVQVSINLGFFGLIF